MNRTAPWDIADLVDFEFLLDGDAAGTSETASRDTDKIFQSTILPVLRDTGTLSRPVVFKAWLDLQREAAKQPLPGEHLKTAWQTLFVLCILTGLGFGGSLTAALLFYRDTEPVNVSWFLACTLGSQILVLTIVGVLLILRRTTDLLNDFRPLQALLAGLTWAMSTGLKKLQGEQRERVRAVLARISRRREIYGSVATWPMAVLTQVFGVCFNLGILATFLAHFTFKDIDFGWQSSFVESDEVAFQIASGIAVPWRWFAPRAHPTLLEVANSHFMHKEQLSNKAWGPFLWYAVACYGLFPRVALLALAFSKWRGAMCGLTFDHDGCSSIYRRLLGPVVHSQGGTAKLEIPPDIVTKGERASSGGSFVIISTDIEISEDRLASYIRDKYGWSLAATRSAEIDYPSSNADMIAALTDVAARIANVIIVVPARRSPIKAIALFVQKVAKAASANRELILLLVGREESAAFAPVDPEAFTYWKNFVAINQLHVSLEKWNPT